MHLGDYEFMGVSNLRQLNARRLRKQEKPIVVLISNVPTVVIIPYKEFISTQEILRLTQEAHQYSVNLLSGERQ